jgi:hypothetical protein
MVGSGVGSIAPVSCAAACSHWLKKRLHALAHTLGVSCLYIIPILPSGVWQCRIVGCSFCMQCVADVVVLYMGSWLHDGLQQCQVKAAVGGGVAACVP